MMRISSHSKALNKFMLLSVFFVMTMSISINTAMAQLCGADYTVKKDESLASIATKIYGTATQWTIIFYANQDRLGTNASLLVPGLALRVPCIGEAQEQKLPEAATVRAVAAKPSPNKFLLSSLVKRIEFLTAEGYAPLTGRDLPNGGMITEIISASMDLIKTDSSGEFDYKISWVNDWASHLTLLRSRAFDADFPWEIPDCHDPKELDAEAKQRCEAFFFSEPLYEILEVLYVRKNSKFETDADVIGKKICLTADDGLDDVDGGGRNWAKDGKVTLIRPASLEECFRMLGQSAVDGVVSSEMTGIDIAKTLGIADKVMALPHPLKIQTVHVIVSKTHPHARTLLYYVNTALAKLKESGDYDRIVQRHLSSFWAGNETQKSPAGAQSVKGETPTGAAAKPEQSNPQKPPQRAAPEPKAARAQNKNGQ